MSVTFAWLLALIFLPAFGFLFYFFFGSTGKLELMTRKYRLDDMEQEYQRVLAENIHQLSTGEILFRDPKTEQYRDMVRINSRNAQCFFTEDNDVQLLINGQEKFSRMFEEIRGAKESINVMYFIIKAKDPIGRQFIDLLAQKAAEGLDVKVLYDGLGCLKTRLADFAPIVENGGQVQRFLPSVVKTLIEVNYRLHRKMVVIDGRVCYTGGINVGDDYLGNYAHITPWRDTSVRITGTAVQELQIIFFQDWVFCAKQNKGMKEPMRLVDLELLKDQYFPQVEPQGEMGVQIIEFSPDEKYEAHKDSYVKMCTSAKRYLYIQSPYFVPDQTLLDAIRMAAQSGVDVRLMLPGIPDKKYVYNVAMSYVEELLEAGVRVYTHKGFLHAKTLVIDDHVASVGTTNLDLRSFRLDYEVNTLVYNTPFAVACRDTFLKDTADCSEIELAAFRRRGLGRYIMESLCRFIAPLA